MAARRIATDIVEALVPDMLSRFSDLSKASDAELEAAKAEWVELALSKFVSHSIPWDQRSDPLSSNITSRNPKVIEAYFQKYPNLRPYVDFATKQAQTRWPDAHEEYPDKDGFTAAGCRAGLNAVIAPGSTGPRDAIDGWMGTFYHRLPLIHGGLLRIGWGLEGGFAVLDAGSLVGKVMQVDMIVAWPPDKARKIPRRFNPELPNPVPGEDQRAWGYPVTLQCFVREDSSVPVVTRMTLHQGGRDGPVVPCWYSSPTAPSNPLLAPADTYCLIPKAHLGSGTRYHVRAEFEGWPHRKEWSFQTGR